MNKSQIGTGPGLSGISKQKECGAPVLDVVGAHVLVLQVVCVLPHVNALPHPCRPVKIQVHSAQSCGDNHLHYTLPNEARDPEDSSQTAAFKS